MKPDLSIAPLKTLASLIINGRLELGEIPIGRRDGVAGLVELMKNPRPEIVESPNVPAPALESKVPKPALPNLNAMTVKELLKIAADYPSIKYESRMRKADIIAAIEAAHAAKEQ